MCSRWLLPAEHRPGPRGRLGPRQLSGTEARPPGTCARLPVNPLHVRFLRTHYAQGSREASWTHWAPTVKVQGIEPATVIVLFNCAAGHKRGSEGQRVSSTWGASA